MSQEVLNAIQQIFPPDSVVELRVPKTKKQGTISGYFNNAQKLTEAITELSGKHPGVYYTLNPCEASLLARTDNQLETRASATTTDEQITHRQWLLIDADPVRPSGISASDTEKEL